jgi:DNA-binding CsgD family transcriptional regulator
VISYRRPITRVRSPEYFTRQDNMLSALDMLPLGIVVLNRNARILFANTYASGLLSASTDLTVVDGILRARSTSHKRALSEALNSLAHNAALAPIGFSIARTNQRPLSVVLAQLPHRAKTLPTPGRSRIVVFLSDPDFGHRPNAALIHDLFQFTPVESAIAMLMMESLDTGAIASQLAITRNTLRDHLKAMFSKTHTRNQSELLHTLLRCPASLRFPVAEQDQL